LVTVIASGKTPAGDPSAAGEFIDVLNGFNPVSSVISSSPELGWGVGLRSRVGDSVPGQSGPGMRSRSCRQPSARGVIDRPEL